MKKLTPKACYRKLAALYTRMADAYADAAGRIGLSCAGCADNCCHSYFQHHTYVEWAYLWQGLTRCPNSACKPTGNAPRTMWMRFASP